MYTLLTLRSYGWSQVHSPEYQQLLNAFNRHSQTALACVIYDPKGKAKLWFTRQDMIHTPEGD